MDFSDQSWQGLVEAFTGTLGELQASAEPVAALSAVEAQEALGTIGSLDETASAHLANSRAVEEYLLERVDDPEAKQVLATVGVADFDAAGVLLAAAEEEPEPGLQALADTRRLVDVDAVRAEMLGMRGVGGSQANPPALTAVEKNCDEILGLVGDQLADLAGNVASAVTAEQVLDGFAAVLGPFEKKFDEAREKLAGVFKRMKEKGLSLLERGVAKLAAFLRVDADRIKEKLKEGWKSAKSQAGDWAANLLGREAALAKWRGWLGGEPSPSQAQIDGALKRVEDSLAAKKKHLDWSGKGIKLLDWVDGAVAAIPSFGPALVVLIASALGAWTIWSGWDHLRDVAAAIS